MNQQLEPAGYAEPETGPGRCANCGGDFDDHRPCWHCEVDGRGHGRFHCGVFFCADDGEYEFDERDPDDATWDAAAEKAGV